MPKFVLIILVVITCCSCREPIQHTYSNHGFTLIDTNSSQTHINRRDANLDQGYYPVYYLGKQMAIIRIGEHNRRYSDNERIDVQHLQKFAKNIAFSVDTSSKLSYTNNFEHWDNKTNKLILDSSKFYPSYAIIIKNNSDSLFYAGIFGELGRTVMQAKNGAGKWVDIEKEISYSCTSGSRPLTLAPREMIIAKLILYEGDYQTNCRLKLNYFGQPLYSNTFTYSINKAQLLLPKY